MNDMSPFKKLDQIREAIETLGNCEEHTTESFRIVINTLKQKEAELLKKMGKSFQ